MRALVLGASGFIGGHLMAHLGERQAIGTYYRRPFPGGVPFDGTVGGLDALLRHHGRFSHAFVLYGAIDVENCARDPLGTRRANVESVGRVLRALLEAGVVPIYLSSDYVFDGTRGGWRESDHAHPCTQYGAQKLEVERVLLDDPRPSLIVRLSRVVGTELGTHSVLGPWVEDLRAGRRIRCATDQVFSPASVEDVAGAIVKLADRDARGLFHLGGPEAFSRMELLQLLVASVRAVMPQLQPDILPCSLHDLPFLEQRPLNTSIVSDRLQAAIGWHFVPMAAVCDRAAQLHFGAGARVHAGG